MKNSQLINLKTFAGTLLHEISHAKSGAPDVSREFENELTYTIGEVVRKTLDDN